MIGRTPWLAGTLGVAIAVACAARPGAEPDRVAELEARVARLEAELAKKQAPTDAQPVELDGSEGERPPVKPDFAAAEPDPHAECLSQIERQCRQYLAEPGAPDGGLAWQKLVPPDATPAGRDCMARARARCDTRDKQQQAWDKKLAALDAELDGPRADRAFGELVTKQLQPFRLVARCSRQFCRIDDPEHVMDAGALDWGRVHHELLRLSDAGGGMSYQSPGHMYFTRDGYRFPE